MGMLFKIFILKKYGQFGHYCCAVRTNHKTIIIQYSPKPSNFCIPLQHRILVRPKLQILNPNLTATTFRLPNYPNEMQRRALERNLGQILVGVLF